MKNIIILFLIIFTLSGCEYKEKMDELDILERELKITKDLRQEKDSKEMQEFIDSVEIRINKINQIK